MEIVCKGIDEVHRNYSFIAYGATCWQIKREVSFTEIDKTGYAFSLAIPQS
jgi:hypothetical protein